jgi:hypothetical protein
MKALRITLAVLITLVVVVASRYFGPNRQYTVETSSQGVEMAHKAPRGHDEGGPAPLWVKVRLNGKEASDLMIGLKGRVKGAEAWEGILPSRTEPGEEGWDQRILFEVPEKPWTTRYFYQFDGCVKGGEPFTLTRDDGNPMMVKFKGKVPAWIVILHVLGMFGGFFLLILSTLHAWALAWGREDYKAASSLAWWSWLVLFIGGVPVGFAMNYFAFNVIWEAFPFGGDVTDNKTQIALILWALAAMGLSYKKNRRSGVFAVVAGLLVLAIFLIPHSAQVG